MSLAKQLILLISIMFLAIFTVNFYASMTNIRDYLQIESEIHAQDTATSLGLSLSPYILDEDNSILETMINAIFDRGYYLEIVLENRKGKELVRKTNPETFEEVPHWFTALLPLETATSRSDIDAGWVKGGTVYVTIHPGIGYLKLWEQAKRTLAYSALMLVASIIILTLILQLVLRPLAKIDRLARSIADGNFDSIDQLPWTTEIRNIAISMNFMSGKIENVINNLNERLEETGRRLRVDELTGLETKGTLETEMKQRFMSGGSGYLFVIRIDDLGGFAQANSSRKVDEFILDFVATIQQVLKDADLSEEHLYRIVGAEFVFLADCRDKDAAENLCEKLMAKLIEFGKSWEKPDVAHIGGVVFDPHGTTASMISTAMEAYEKATLISDNAFAISDESKTSHDKDQWKAMVRQVIDNEQVEVEYSSRAFSMKPGDEDNLVIEEAIAKVYDSAGKPLPIGTFVSVAENIGGILTFDLYIVRKVIEYIRRENVEHDVAVNLSFSSLSNNEFRARLYELLDQNEDIRNKLAFCVTAYGATKDVQAFASFIEYVHRNGAKIILKRFESRFIPMSEIKQFKLDYIRLAKIYTEHISTDREKRRLVEAMKELGDILDISILAEGVESDRDYSTLQEINLTAVSR